MMLDMRRTFDDMVRVHAGPERAEQLLANPFYQTISTSFSGTQEYMAMEKLGQLAATGDWDLIIVDTPPSRSALDFLDAPTRLSSALDGRMIRLLTGPAKAGGWGLRKVVNAGFSHVREGRVDDHRRPAADRRVGVHAGLRHHVRRLPRAGAQDRRAAALAGHRVPGGGRAGAGRAARGVLLRGAAVRRSRCRWPGWSRTAPTRCSPSCPAPKALAAADSLEARPTRRWPRPCCGCTPTGWRWRSARSGCWPGSPGPTPRCRVVRVPALAE